MEHSPAFLALATKAIQHIKETDVHSVQALPETRSSGQPGETVLLDVREESEWQRGYIPGAVHLGRGIIERDIERRYPDKNTPFILYCGGGYRSALAAESLQKMGYTNVLSMSGGFTAWKKAGYMVAGNL